MKKNKQNRKPILIVIALMIMVGVGFYFRNEIPNALRTGMDSYMEAEQIRLEARMNLLKKD